MKQKRLDFYARMDAQLAQIERQLRAGTARTSSSGDVVTAEREAIRRDMDARMFGHVSRDQVTRAGASVSFSALGPTRTLEDRDQRPPTRRDTGLRPRRSAHAKVTAHSAYADELDARMGVTPAGGATRTRREGNAVVFRP